MDDVFTHARRARSFVWIDLFYSNLITVVWTLNPRNSMVVPLWIETPQGVSDATEILRHIKGGDPKVGFLTFDDFIWCFVLGLFCLELALLMFGLNGGKNLFYIMMSWRARSVWFSASHEKECATPRWDTAHLRLEPRVKRGCGWWVDPSRMWMNESKHRIALGKDWWCRD